MSLSLLLAWWNLIYIIPFGLALFYLGLFVFTGITFGDADADMDADADASVHVEAHVADIGADADADANADHDADAPTTALAHAGPAMLAHSVDLQHAGNGAGHASTFGAFLSFLGVGKIPISLALMILLFCWGISGFALNALLFQWLGNTALIAIISGPLALAISLTLTGLAAALIARIIPNDDSTRQRHTDLVGKPGEAMYDINAEFGMARVRGDAGDFFQVPCRTRAGAPRIPKGARIILFDYDREKGVFEVASFQG